MELRWRQSLKLSPFPTCNFQLAKHIFYIDGFVLYFTNIMIPINLENCLEFNWLKHLCRANTRQYTEPSKREQPSTLRPQAKDTPESRRPQHQHVKASIQKQPNPNQPKSLSLHGRSLLRNRGRRDEPTSRDLIFSTRGWGKP